ncbi:MAG: hypothetical protein V1747_09925 [Candidatus Omnitrophota bacterium]
MKTKAGLWIDHKKAIVVAITDKGEEAIEVIISETGKQPRRSGDCPLKGDYESQQAPESDVRQKTLTGQLNVYYNEIIASIRQAESILIFGPGEAKTELKKRLEKSSLGKRIVGVETVDKLTDHQIAAKVRKYFSEEA